MSDKILAAHVLVSSQMNAQWAETLQLARFDAVDHITIGPFQVGSDGKFILGWSNERDLHKRVTDVIAKARKDAASANRTIKIFAMQVSESEGGTIPGIHRLGDPVNVNDAAKGMTIKQQMYTNYITSISAILHQYDFDGWAVDYMPPDNVSLAPKLFHDVKEKLTEYGNKLEPKRQYQVAVLASTTRWLRPSSGSDAEKYPVTESVDFVYLKTYYGGLNNANTLSAWLDTVKYPKGRLLYGLVTEQKPAQPTAKEARDAVAKNELGGIHIWRLDGARISWSSQVQLALFSWLHSGVLDRNTLALQEVDAAWKEINH
ncbi:hypothetical protein B0T16DRAFT_503070 [Cercophora newfieldiana]|uniref:Chitinase n=1 Tax=Cercophora newfieldiana TaxID=92897 RepID=A0AA39YUY2_9PEZI|nr:hypothetical protein B0T16DRAFT_503070 [Cercophora newfieldiana]